VSDCGFHARFGVGASQGRGLEEGKKGSRNSDRKRTTLVTMRNLDKSKGGQPFLEVFVRCAQGVGAGELITRESRQDKEFHFQNWFRARLTETGLNFEAGGRNSYPDFRLVASTDGFEVKGLAYPGREANYGCNSQVPSGNHNGRTIYYVFGRYPAEPDGDTYPVLDLVVCHGDFLNVGCARRQSGGGAGAYESYGGMLIRGRKRYVAPTPFALTVGTAHNQTLILPTGSRADSRFEEVGRLVRHEPEKLVIGYAFDTRANTLVPELVDNPSAGREHSFSAFRLKGVGGEEVAMRLSAESSEAPAWDEPDARVAWS
jgi:hypothetical protein